MAGRKQPSRSIKERLNAAQLALNNTLAVTEIQEAVGKYGYNRTKVEGGQALYKEALAAVEVRDEAAGAQQAATDKANAARTSAREVYQALAKVARAIFAKDRAKLTSLGLTGRMPAAAGEFLGTAYALFDNAVRVADVRTALSEYGYDEARLQEERAKMEAYDLANQAQEAALGAAQQATRDQDAALKALDEWVAQFLKIARVALRGKPELLEQLGITVRSTPSGRRRKAKTSPAAPS